jgi:rSAM/selenodomain-associated transferase 1
MAAEQGVAGLLLIQFAREPVPGKVKTRLIPALGAAAAARLHERLLLHTLEQLLACELGSVQLWVAGDVGHPALEPCRKMQVPLLTQQGNDLGERMLRAFQSGLADHERVILVGSDVPGLSSDYVMQAAEALEGADAVIGPACDGGYVLIGLRRVSAVLFSGVEWGSAAVLEQTEQRLGQLGWKWTRLSPLPDIDRPEDLRYVPETLL